MKIPCALTVFLLFPILINAYTWQFTSPPIQCKNVTLSIQGSGGQPPYSLLLIPTGASPIPNVEVRSAETIPFSGTSTTLSFNLNYPENSTFVAVVSDKSGFGTGGTSGSISVLKSSDSSCYSPSKPSKVPWWFYFDPQGGLTQCVPVRLWWDASLVNGTVNFYGAIPGGTAFTIPQGSLSSNNQTGTGFNWTVDIAGGADVLLIGNDDRGIAAGGHVEYTVANSVNTSCLDSNSPSSTPGTPAGGSYPTSTSKSSHGSHTSSNTGAIVGGVVGGVILLVSAFWFVRRRLYSAVSQPRPVDVLQNAEDGNEDHWHNLPQNYVPEPFGPFLVSDSNIRGTSESASTQYHPLSMSTVTADGQSPQTPTTSKTATRNNAAFPQPRPIRIIQHDDASPSENLSGQLESEPETIELPPAYSNIRRPQRPLLTSPVLPLEPATAAEDES